jgi:alcohol dehydrogenase class IV
MATINYITQVQIGFGSLDTLKEACQRLGLKHPLITTDPGIAKTGILPQVTRHLDTGYEIFDQTPPNPNEHAIRAAARQYRDKQCDGVIAVGGGSSIDLGKAVAICATHEGPLKQFAFIEGGANRITAATAPLIAIPTTAGTGSEVGRGAVVILEDGRKVALISPYVVPKLAICDPTLTLGLPKMLTAATGMDAVTHCMETFMAPAFNPPADGIALDGLQRAWENIERATFEPANRDARLNMMCASMEGAMAFQKGLGCVHSLSHSLGGINPTLHHGTLNAIFLPAVIRFNTPCESMVREKKLQRMAHAMGLPANSDIAQAVESINERLGLPTRLSQLGVKRDSFEHIVEGAFADHSHKTNPREASHDDYVRILEESF